MENDLKSLKEQYHINEIASVERFTPNKRKYTVFIISDSNMSQVHVCIKKYNVSKALVLSDQGWQYQNIRYSY